MSYKCKDCGNDKEFEKPATDSIMVMVDGEGHYTSTMDTTGNMVITDEFIICHKCQSENVTWFEPKQVELGAVAGGEK